MESRSHKNAILPFTSSEDEVNANDYVPPNLGVDIEGNWPIFTENVRRWIDRHMAEGVDFEQKNAVIAETAEPPPDLTMPLLRYQKEFLAWASKQELSVVKGGILADEMGMGKTIQAISLVLARRKVDRAEFREAVGCTLVLCPPVALSQWLDEISRLTSPGSTKVLEYHGAKRAKNAQDFKNYDFVLTTYSTVEFEFREIRKNMGRRMSPLHSIKWNRIILDEAHGIKNHLSHTAKSVFALEATYRWALSGTPLQNHIGELYSLIRFLRVYPYSYNFCKKCDCQVLDKIPYGTCPNCSHYALQHACWWLEIVAKPIREYGRPERGKRANIFLKHKVLKDIFLRRTKLGRAADLALPPRIISLRRVALDTAEADYYESLYKDSQAKFNTYVQAGTLMNNYANIFGLLTRLIQAVNHPYLVMHSSSSGANANLLDENKNEQECGLCHDEPDMDYFVTSCAHVFCKSCLIGSSTSLGKVTCPTCSKLVSVDVTTKADTEHQASKTKLKGFRASSILNRINLNGFKTSTKIEALREEIRFMFERDGSAKAIVFSQFTSFLDLISYALGKSGVSYVQLVGSMSRAARDAAVNKFKEDPDCRVFLTGLKTGGVALNLTAASHVFMMDPWWNPAVERQSQDRIHRIGQYKPIRVVRFIIEKTVEERILTLQKKNEDLFESTVGDSDEEAVPKLSEDDIKSLFA